MPAIEDPEEFDSHVLLKDLKGLQTKVKNILEQKFDDSLDLDDIDGAAELLETSSMNLIVFNNEVRRLLDLLKTLMKDLANKLRKLIPKKKLENSEKVLRYYAKIKLLESDIAKTIVKIEKAVDAATKAEKAALEATAAADRALQFAREAQEAIDEINRKKREEEEEKERRRLEKERKEKEDEERRQREEEERQKQKEREEEERKRKEEEKLKKEQEKEEKRKQKEEEERLRKEKAEEERKRKEEEERLRREQEEEEERKRKEEEERLRKEKEEEERKRKEEEERLRREEEERKRIEEEERRRLEEEERLRREAEERKAQTLSFFEIDRPGGDFDGGLACVVRGDPELYKVTCRSVDPEIEGDLICGDSELIISNIIHICSANENDNDEFSSTTLEKVMYVAIPYNHQQVRGGSAREVVIKAQSSPGVWQEVQTYFDVNPDGYKNLRFAVAAVQSLSITLVVIVRLRSFNVRISRKSGAVTSVPNLDKNIAITFQLPEGSRSGKDVEIILKMLPLESDMKSKMNLLKGLLTSSSIFSIAWPKAGYTEKVTMNLSLAPLPPAGGKGIPPGTTPRGHPKLQAGRIEDTMLSLVRKTRAGQWARDDQIAVNQIRPDAVEFQFMSPLERFVILRHLPAFKEYIEKFAGQIENLATKHSVCSVLRQKGDNPCEAIQQLVLSSRVDSVLRRFQNDGYTEGPEPSEEFLLDEGEKVTLSFQGNIRGVDKQAVETRTVRMCFDRPRQFTVDVVDKYIQKHYSTFNGAVHLMWTKSKTGKGGENGPGTDDKQVLVIHEISIPKDAPRGFVVRRVPVAVKDEKVLRYVASQLGDDWSDLSKPLQIAPTIIANIFRLEEVGEADQERMKYEMLTSWYKLQPQGVNKIGMLAEILNKCGQKNVASLMENFMRKQQREPRETSGD